MKNESGLIPVEFNVVVAIDATEERTAGGIILPSQVQDKDALATQEGTLVAISPHAFSYAEGWPEGTLPRVGQRVLFKRYAGTGGGVYKKTVDGVEREFRLMPDKDIAAIIEPDAPAMQAAA
jgi:co-chaperonin GroES (HSP10)